MIYHFDDLSFCLLSVGTVKHTSGHFHVKARPHAAFALRLSGSACFTVAGEQFTSGTNEITYIPADTPYEADYTEGESIFVHLTACNYSHAENMAVDNPLYYKSVFTEMLDAWQKCDANRVKSLLFHLLHRLSEREKAATGDAAFLKCLSYIEEHYTEPEMTLTQAAHAGYISTATLRRRYRTYLGISPKEHLLKLRLSRALSLLGGGASVKEAAGLSGFSDEKFFARSVKRRYGVPPSAFRP